MAGTKYTVPLGVDSENLINPLNDTIDTLEKVERSAKEAGKELQEGFNKGSKAADSLEDKIKPIQKGLEAVKTLGKQAGKELADAFNERNIDPSKLEKAVAGFQNKLSSLTAKVDIQIDASKLSVFEKQLSNAKNEVQELEIAVQMAKEVMSTLDPNSEEFQQLGEAITFTETALGEFAQNVDTTVTKQKSLKTELREIKSALQQMELAGEAGSQKFMEMSIRAGELEDQIGDTSAQIKILASDEKYFEALASGAEGLVGAFTAVQGAAALFGGENEQVDRILQKVMGSMAVLQGLQAVAATLNKDSAFSVIFLRSARTSEAAATAAQAEAQIVLTAATTAETAATQALAVAETELAAATTAATVAAQAHAVANTEETAAILAAATAAEAEAMALRQNAAGELAAAQGATANATAQVAQTGAMGGATVAAGVLRLALSAIGIGLIIAAVAYLIEYWDDLTAEFKKFLPAGASMQKTFDTVKAAVLGVGSAVIQYLITPFKVLIDLLQGDVEGAMNDFVNGMNVVKNTVEGYNDATKRIAAQHALEDKEARMKQWDNAIAIAEAEGKDVYQTKKRWYENNIALLKKQGKDTEDAEQELALFLAKKRGQDAKDAEAARKKAEADAKKAADKAAADAKKAAEEAKKQAELVLKYTNEINTLRISSIKDSYEQERESIKAEAQNKIRDLAKDDAKTAAARQKQAELILAINEDANNRLKELEKTHNAEIAALRLEGAKMLEDLAKDSKDKALNVLSLETQEKLDQINEQYAQEAELREKLTAAVIENDARQRQEIAIEYGQQELDDNEQKAIAILEMSRNMQTESIKQEEQYQLALLEIKKQAAEKALQLLLDNGKTDNDVEVANARLKVKQIQDAINDEAKKGKKFDMMEFLGIGGGWSKEETAAVKQAASDLLSNISQITDGLVEQYQRQIDKKQESIDQINSEIDDLENQLDKEQELKEKGLANNVETIQKEIEAKKAQRDEEIRQQKEMQKKQAEIQKAQMAVDTAVQLVNMITSATNIFNSLSGIPFVGVPLAIALIATMFGAFAMTKAKAFQAIKSGQQYGGGGWIDGYSHAQGGTKYFNADGTEVRELEKDEFVTNKKSAKQYAPLLEAINSGNFDNLTFADLGTMGLLGAMGITFNEDDVEGAVEDSRELEAVAAQINVITGSKNHDFSKMEGDIAYLAKRKREEAETWEDEKYYYRKVGSKITKIKKQ